MYPHNKIIAQCLERGITVQLSKDGYEIFGFAKSGKGLLSFLPTEEGEYALSLRYNTVENIRTFEDIVHTCFEWCDRYIDRGYGWDWADTFVEFGLLKKEVTTTTKYTK